MSASEFLIRERYRAIYAVDERPEYRLLRGRDEQDGALVLIAELAASDESARSQLARFAAQVASLRHDGLLPLRDHFAEGEFYYLVSNDAGGQELERTIRMRGGPLPEADVLAQAATLLNLAEYVHEQRPPLFLGDPSPHDVWVRDDGSWVVAPFTLVRPIGVTLSSYRAPELEQAEVEPTTASDLYAVSALLYLAVTGWPPTPAARQNEGAPLAAPRSLNPSVSALFEQALLRGLQVRAANRYQVAREMRVALETLRLMGGRSLGLGPDVIRETGGASANVAASAPLAPAPVAEIVPVAPPAQPAPVPVALPPQSAPPEQRRGMSTGCIVALTLLALLVGIIACVAVALLFTPLRQVIGLAGAPLPTPGPTLAPATGQNPVSTDGPTVVVPTPLPIELGAGAITIQNARTISQTDVITTVHFGPVAFDPSGSLVAVAIDEQINLRDASTLAEAGQLVGHQSPVFALAWSSDGKLLASGGSNESDIRIWDVAAKKERLVLKGHSDWVRSLAFSPDGTMLASGSVDNTIRLWNVADGAERTTLSGHTDWVGNIAFSPDGGTLASASRDGSVRTWDVATGRQRAGFSFQTALVEPGQRSWTNGLAYSPDGTVIAVGSTDRIVYLLDAKTGAVLHQLAGHTNWIVIRGLAFSPDGATLYSSGLDGSIRVWDVKSGTQINQFDAHELGVVGISVSADGKQLISVSDQEGVMLVWDTTTAKVVRTFQTGQGVILSMVYSPDSEVLGLAGYNGTMRLIRVSDSAGTQPFAGSARTTQSIGFVGSKLVAITDQGTTVVTDLSNGDSKELTGLSGTPESVVANRDGTMIAGGSNTGAVVLWDAASGEVKTTLKTSFSRVQVMHFSYDGSLLAVAGISTNPQIEVWNVADGTQVSTLSGPTDRITDMAFQPGGVLLAAASADRSLTVWDARTGDNVRQFAATSDQGWYLSVAFSADGSILAAGSLSGDLQLWNMRDGAEITRVDMGGSVFALAFSPDGTQLSASVTDGTVRILRP